MVRFIVLFFIATQLTAQNKTAASFGFTHLQIMYQGDTVDVLIKSKPGNNQKAKPLFFFCQGSQPIPLIKTDGEKLYSIFPFTPDSLSNEYHIVIVSKPHVPLIADVKTLTNNFNYIDAKTQKPPKKYSDKNLLSYYVNRNLYIINYLQKQSYVSKNKLVVAGHSEGSTIAAKMAQQSNKITHLIYASGNPQGRIMAMVARDRAIETDTDSTRYTQDEFVYWQNTVNNKNSLNDSLGDTYKATYNFSIPPIQYLLALKIPVLICYGTKDESAPFNDYLHIETIRQKKQNFTYNAYIGLEHNFFPLTKNNKPDYSQYNWNKIATDWQTWAATK
ncbi:MAG TPA: dienelactone hydrolase family protein [Bacteroidia bacterium]|nr:dienelactone hydrolase family protein [Bacteroidia bacterium]